MKYKYLKDQNESFRKQIEEQNQLINSQTILIDKLTSEKIDLLSKIEIKNINYKKFKKPIDTLKLKINITPYMKDIIDTLNSKTEKVILDNHGVHTIPSEAEKIAMAAILGDFAQVSLGINNAIFSIKKLTEAIYINEPKTVKTKSKDWYQKHNNKQRFQGKNR